MNDFRSGNRSRDRRSSYGRNSGGRSSGRREMHSAVCDSCGKDCKVPFRPSGDKPIYCSDCFEEKGGREGSRQDRGSSRRRDFGRRSSAGSPQGNISNLSISQLSKSIETLSTKLDSIITLLSATEKEKVSSKVKDESKKTNKVKVSKAKTVKKKTTKARVKKSK